MWKLKSIKAENIAAIKKITYTLHQGVTTLIFGCNLDNDSQGSNGSGKSALLESIALALTGDTLRHVKMDEIINDQSDIASVCAELYNDDLKESLIIQRTLSRKYPQEIQCAYYHDGEKINCVQANVADYNNFICRTLGINKDDLLNNFILSKHKYKSFLDSNDKEKKEIINRISNAVLVDTAIEELEADIEKSETLNRAVEIKVASAKAAMDVLDEQIANAIQLLKDNTCNRSQQIQHLQANIKEKENENIGLEQEVKQLTLCVRQGQDKKESVQKLSDNTGLVDFELYRQLNDVLKDISDGKFANWKDEIQKRFQKIETLHKQVDALEVKLKENESLRKSYEQEHGDVSSIDADIAKYSQQLQQSIKEEQDIIAQQEKAEEQHTLITKKILECKRQIAELKNSIAGVIQCPKCSHQFVVGSNVDVRSTKSAIAFQSDRLTEYEDNAEDFQKQISHIHSQISEKRNTRNTLSATINSCSQKKESIQAQIRQYENTKNRIQDEVEGILHQIDKTGASISVLEEDMLDDALNIVENYITTINNKLKLLTSQIASNRAIIESSVQAINEIQQSKDDYSLVENLKKSKEEKTKSLMEAMNEASEVHLELEVLNMQKVRFVEFKTFLANTKIEALNQVTNDFLDRIGSDIRIQFSGYTILKSGKIRDKISISLIRNGIDGGSFDKFSEGEKARVNLANILAMNALANANAEIGRGLDLLVLDEILEATDENGLTNIFHAINQLKITSLIVSHGNIAENYPYRLVINKQNGISFINE